MHHSIGKANSQGIPVSVGLQSHLTSQKEISRKISWIGLPSCSVYSRAFLCANVSLSWLFQLLWHAVPWKRELPNCTLPWLWSKLVILNTYQTHVLFTSNDQGADFLTISLTIHWSFVAVHQVASLDYVLTMQYSAIDFLCMYLLTQCTTPLAAYQLCSAGNCLYRQISCKSDQSVIHQHCALIKPYPLMLVQIVPNDANGCPMTFFCAVLQNKKLFSRYKPNRVICSCLIDTFDQNQLNCLPHSWCNLQHL